MSPTKLAVPRSASIQAGLDRIWADLGAQIRAERQRRRWSTQTVADRAGVSRWAVYMLERGEPTSLEVALRCLSALGLRLELTAVDPRKRSASPKHPEDPVHAAMGELEAGVFRGHGFSGAIDEPYQHYQFAGRADVVAWSVERAALIHIENRTQFPNLQEAAGSYNAKRAYLAPILAERFGVRRWHSVTHVMACLWSSEVLHALRLHPETFRSLAPDPSRAFEALWSGGQPGRGTMSTLIVLDPIARDRAAQWVDLESALGNVRPRYRDYAEAAAALVARSG